MIAQFLQPGATQFWIFLGCIFTLVGGAYAILRLRNEWRKSHESDEPKRRLLPSPIITRQEDPPVLASAFGEQNRRRDQELKEMEARIEKRIDTHEVLVRKRLHELSDSMNDVAVEAKNGREIATEQFQKIEGRLGELRSTTEHTNALSIRTDQRVQKMAEDLPDKIASALNRGRRT
jgi:hypothetical protein